MPSLRLLVHSLKLKKENAVNYGKLAMLYRLAGGGPISIFKSDDTADVLEVYRYLQEICNNSKDLAYKLNAVTTENPFLAYNLKEIAATYGEGLQKRKITSKKKQVRKA